MSEKNEKKGKHKIYRKENKKRREREEKGKIKIKEKKYLIDTGPVLFDSII